MNEGSLIAPISSLHRYLSEANDSILSHMNNDEDSDFAGANPETDLHNLSEPGNSHVADAITSKHQ